MKFDWTKLVSWIPFNQGNAKTQAGVLLIITLLLFGFATKCHADDNYIQFGVGHTVVRGKAAMVDLTLVYPKLGPGDTTVEFGTTFIGLSDYEGQEQRNNFAWHAAIVDGFGRFDVGIGPAYLQNIDTYNGSNLNYILLVGYRFERWPVTLRMQHFSNGGTRRPNKGRDMLFLAWRF